MSQPMMAGYLQSKMVEFIQLTVPVLEGKYKLTFKCTRKNKKRRKVDYFYLINDSLQPKILSRDFFLIILVLHEVVAPVEDMDFTRPTIRQKKMKSTCKPKATIFDARPSYMARTNPALEFRKENQVTK